MDGRARQRSELQDDPESEFPRTCDRAEPVFAQRGKARHRSVFRTAEPARASRRCASEKQQKHSWGDLLGEGRDSLHRQARTATEPLIRGFEQLPELLSWEKEAVFRLRLWIERIQTRSAADTVQRRKFLQVKKVVSRVRNREATVARPPRFERQRSVPHKRWHQTRGRQHGPTSPLKVGCIPQQLSLISGEKVEEFGIGH
jgi:hypothetical protein